VGDGRDRLPPTSYLEARHASRHQGLTRNQENTGTPSFRPKGPKSFADIPIVHSAEVDLAL